MCYKAYICFYSQLAISFFGSQRCLPASTVGTRNGQLRYDSFPLTLQFDMKTSLVLWLPLSALHTYLHPHQSRVALVAVF